MLFLGVLALRITVQKFYAKLSFFSLKVMLSFCLNTESFFSLYISIVFLACLSQYWPLCVVNMKVQVFFCFREEFLIIVFKILFIFFLCMLALFCLSSVYCSSLDVFYSFHFCFISFIFFLISTHLCSYCTLWFPVIPFSLVIIIEVFFSSLELFLSLSTLHICLFSGYLISELC